MSAAGAAELGAKVALIERNLMGGDCLNVGCVPSKGVIRAARAVHRLAKRRRIWRSPELTVRRLIFAAAMERMRRLRAGISEHDSAERFRKLGVDVYIGNGRFVGPSTIEVDGKRLEFNRAVIATGARAAEPPIAGLANAGYYTNETIFTLTELPRRMVVIGAGPIGCELAQVFPTLRQPGDLDHRRRGDFAERRSRCRGRGASANEQGRRANYHREATSNR